MGIESQCRSKVLLCLLQAEVVPRAESTEEFQASIEILSAEDAILLAACESERSGSGHRISEFPRLWLVHRFLGDEVLRYIPTLHIGRENQFSFYRAFNLLFQKRIRHGQ